MAFPLSARSFDWLKVGSGIPEDGDLIAFMCRPLTREQVLERRDRFGLTGEPVTDRQHYMCIYWDEDTRRCGIYEQRPQLCRGYPGYGSGGPEHVCEHGCDCIGEDVPSRYPPPPYMPSGALHHRTKGETDETPP